MNNKKVIVSVILVGVIALLVSATSVLVMSCFNDLQQQTTTEPTSNNILESGSQHVDEIQEPNNVIQIDESSSIIENNDYIVNENSFEDINENISVETILDDNSQYVLDSAVGYITGNDDFDKNDLSIIADTIPEEFNTANNLLTYVINGGTWESLSGGVTYENINREETTKIYSDGDYTKYRINYSADVRFYGQQVHFHQKDDDVLYSLEVEENYLPDLQHVELIVELVYNKDNKLVYLDNILINK